MTLRVLVSGQKAFGADVADALARRHEIVAVVAPALTDDGERWDRLRSWADRAAIEWIQSEYLRAPTVPDDVDVIVAAHSHAFVGRKTRHRATVALGYHPSLLPLHRGRDAVRWTIRDGDRVAGGTVYHLSDNVDGGPVALQDYALVPPGSTASSLWREILAPMGVELIVEALDRIAAGDLPRIPQDDRLATWEPAWGAPPLFRPELPELRARA